MPSDRDATPFELLEALINHLPDADKHAEYGQLGWYGYWGNHYALALWKELEAILPAEYRASMCRMTDEDQYCEHANA